MKTAIIIPARLDSKRLPRKLLREVCGKPVLRWTWEIAKAAKEIDAVIVATQDQEIHDAVLSWGGESVITDHRHENGTSRVCEAARHLGKEFVGIINCQADQVTAKPEWLDRMAYLLKFKDWERPAYTVCCNLPDDEQQNPSSVKVAVANNMACYFTRSHFPGARKHVGIYGFRRSTLEQIANIKTAAVAKLESLEQLSWMGHFQIGVIDAREHVSVSIDTEADLEKFAESRRAANGAVLEIR